jgi:putative flippase GtrA
MKNDRLRGRIDAHMVRRILYHWDWRRLAKFVLVGMGGAVVFYLLLLLMVEGLRIGVMTATGIAFVVVVLQTYWLHYAWTFNSAALHVKVLPRFFLMSGTGFGINWSIMFVGVELLGFNYLLIQTAAIGAVVTWNFLITHLIIFRDDLDRRSHLRRNAVSSSSKPVEKIQGNSSPS